MVRTAACALCLAAAMAACSGSGSDTGSQGGWRVSGVHIRLSGDQHDCATPAPALDTFSGTPSPDPNCSPQAKGEEPSPSPEASATPGDWKAVRVERQYHDGSDGSDGGGGASSGTEQWKPIYSTYTAPPGTGVYQPMVNATDQPMPTPFYTPTPAPLQTAAASTTPSPLPTMRPAPVEPSATP